MNLEIWKDFILKVSWPGKNGSTQNPFSPAKLNDDEIAIATCLKKMDRYINIGEEFYSLAEASQDQYISLMIDKSIAYNEIVTTQNQPWTL